MRKLQTIKITSAVLLTSCITMAQAAVSEQQASELGKSLTPMGGIIAGNTEGTIPRWEGGIKQPPANIGYEGSGKHHTNPFADDKAKFSINAQNLSQYADKLTPGIQEMLKQNPETLWLPIYETRRTHASPEWVNANTRNNAVSAQLVDQGNGVDHAFGGIPFPIPQNGNEAMFNLLLRWQGENKVENVDGLVVSRTGGKTRLGDHFTLNLPYSW